MDRFESFCDSFQKMLGDEGVASERAVSRRIDYGRELVAQLTSDPEWFFERLGRIVLDPALLEGQKPGIWPNEFSLYRSPDRSFVVLAYVWDAGLADTIHDHGSWGIIGPVTAKLRERKYERLDDGKREDFCELRETVSAMLRPGETTFVRPLDEGLHAMDNPTAGIAASINVYGRSMGRGYVQFFDPVNKAVSRIFPPRLAKEVLAARALAVIDPSRAESLLVKALDVARPSPVRREYEGVLRGLRG